ncbi:hypothetical protein [Oceanobacillus chungangensis]|uniref:Uncharacterized protein n=1 Tax=Oceanobacillus chungangensis TaxID=1229152 RepID=A0A3D8PJF2_9BACI|nr:hypothetical protein [Oceanobacillus chungangensis]RDW16213.1 hypothetical protein CWR45_15165 [Oceanobacillus chungangensis]
MPLLMAFVSDGNKQGYTDPNLSNEAILFYLQMFQEYLGKEDVVQMVLPFSEDLTKIFFYGITGKQED